MEFSAGESSDPDGDTLRYDWDFGDGSPHSSSQSPTHTYSEAGSYSARLTVDDGRGRTASTTMAIFPGDTPPAASISAPTGDQTYRNGERIRFEGSAADSEDGALYGAALDWYVVLHHGSHTHDLGSFTGATASFATGTDHDADSFYEITLVATDSAGATSTSAVVVRPETVRLRLESSPPGAPLSYAGTAVTAPFETRSAIGFTTSISAADRFGAAGREYAFAAWSDGGAALRELGIPTTDTAITALYRELAPNPVPGPLAAALGRELPDEAGPALTVTAPASARLRRPLKRIGGRARDPSGVALVEVAVRAARRRGPTCRWWSARRGRLARRSSLCARERWLRASLRRGTSVSWQASLGRGLPRGSYVILFRARDRNGNVSRRLADGRRHLRLRVARPW